MHQFKTNHRMTDNEGKQLNAELNAIPVFCIVHTVLSSLVIPGSIEYDRPVVMSSGSYRGYCSVRTACRTVLRIGNSTRRMGTNQAIRSRRCVPILNCQCRLSSTANS